MARSWMATAMGVWLLFAAPSACAQTESVRTESEPEKAPWYMPEHAAFQLAGSIGMLSAGPGWAFLDEQLEAELLVGWAPEAVAGADFVTLTLKGNWNLFRLSRGQWNFHPLTLGVSFSYTFGDDYFLTLPDRYESGYYWFKTALRAALLLGGSVGRPVPVLGLARLEGYYELVATDYRIVQFVRNPATVNTGLFSLALGARLRF